KVSGPGSITTSGSYNTTVTGVTAGSTTVLQWTISNGVCASSSDQVTLINNQSAVLSSISGTATQCIAAVSGSTTFTVTDLGGTTTYAWTVPAGMTISSGQGSSSITVTWTGTTAGNGIMGAVSVLPSNTCGAGSAVSMTIDYNSAKPVTPGSISGAGKVCPGGTQTYSVSAVARATSYTWTVPTGMSITSGSGTNVITVSISGSYTGGTISVTASNACGTSGVRSKALGLNYPLAAAPISGQVSGLCNQNGVAYTTSGAAYATSYLWSVPAGASIASGQGSASITVNFTSGTGTVTVRGVNSCGTGSIRSLSVVTAPARPSNISGSLTPCINSTESYTANGATGASTYNWSVPSGAVISAGAGSKTVGVTFPAITASNQIITASASNDCGTSPVRSLTGISIISCARAESLISEKLNAYVYPNPVQGTATLYVESERSEQLAVQLSDLSGRNLVTQKLDVQEGVSTFNINVNGFPAGIYFMNLRSQNVEQTIRILINE
ncbi:MAG: T9SS type A sorting domain-containing protein, partial [Bacteroidota bacterium]